MTECKYIGDGKERNISIDVARGIALLLMVIGHLGIKKWPIQYIYAFHMPLFFVISGMTIRSADRFSEYLMKRVKRLLVPYILLASIYSLPGIKFWALDLYGSRSSLAEASSLTPLWFLPTLFVADMVFQIILKFAGGGGTAISKVILTALSALLGVLGVIATHFKFLRFGLPLGIEIALIAMPFVFLGYFIKEPIQKFRLRYKAICSLALLAIPLVLYRFNLPLSVTEEFNHVEMSVGSCGNYALFYINAISGALGIIGLSSAIKKPIFTHRLGKCTLACLATHGLIISSLYAVLEKMGIPFWIEATMAFLFVMLLTYPIQKTAEKFFPNLIGK